MIDHKVVSNCASSTSFAAPLLAAGLAGILNAVGWFVVHKLSLKREGAAQAERRQEAARAEIQTKLRALEDICIQYLSGHTSKPAMEACKIRVTARFTEFDVALGAFLEEIGNPTRLRADYEKLYELVTAVDPSDNPEKIEGDKSAHALTLTASLDKCVREAKFK